jgi:anti-sigma factor (TIGR02949 family)
MTCDQAQELITALVDNELSASERAAIEGHLKECSNCRSVYTMEAVLKERVRSAAAGLAAPAELREKILNDRRVFPPRVVAEQKPRPWAGVFTRPALTLAFLVLVLLPVIYLIRLQSPSLALAAIETHDKIVRGEVTVIRGNSAEAVKEILVRSVAGEFAPMGYDLSMMNLKPVAGTVQTVDGRRVLVALYQGDGGQLTCYTFLGTEKDAPPRAQAFFDADKNMTFYSYSVGRINAVLHREGGLICILVSAMPMPDLLALARSKADPSHS